jgi:hypothetical protein
VTVPELSDSVETIEKLGVSSYASSNFPETSKLPSKLLLKSSFFSLIFPHTSSKTASPSLSPPRTSPLNEKLPLNYLQIKKRIQSDAADTDLNRLPKQPTLAIFRFHSAKLFFSSPLE